ncbi:HEAT repeat domain-containing protein [Verrucomicrobium sp. BvORR106]|uniref:HEAT repeat domain-containing protein n=1 Tax=Verrucomicrobium sp. BvORR106 TaxID=1403819 RepID=UPI0005703DDA|nr:HEAT repeat domain-containing protein [Verrucomicrobium sp. BvORR106]
MIAAIRPAVRCWVVAIVAMSCGLGVPTRSPAETFNTFDTLRIDGAAFSTKDEMVIEGFIVKTNPYRSSAEVAITAARINGRGNTDELCFHLIGSPTESESKKLKKGDWLSVKGRWGQCLKAGPSLNIGFNVTEFQRIPAAPHRFKDFADRDCEMTGTAVAGGRLRCQEEQAAIDGLTEWPPHLLNREVVVRGRLHPAGTGWQWQGAQWHAASLAERIGQEVVLTGRLRSMNGVWWFERKGDEERICLTSAGGRVLTFNSDHHGGSARVTGRLVRELRPALDQITSKVDRDLVLQYTVRAAKVQPLDTRPKGWNYHWISGRPVPMRDGLPVLEAREAVFNGYLGGETRALLMCSHNAQVIEFLQRDESAKRSDFLAVQMEAEGIDPTLKLVYAGMLAARNDERGREVLRQAVADPASPLFPDAVHCLFTFPFLPVADKPAKPEVAWAEDIFLNLLSQDKKKLVSGWALSTDPAHDRAFTPASAVLFYSPALQWLPIMPSARVRQALVKFSMAPSKAEDSEFDGPKPQFEVIGALCADPAPLAPEVLQDWANLLRRERYYILIPLVSRLLQEGDTESILDLGKPGIEALSSIGWREDDLTATQVEGLKKLLPDLLPEAERKLQLQLIRRGPEPAPKLLRLLDDPDWEDKSSILFALRDTKDPRIIKPLLNFLATVKDGALPQEDDLATCSALKHSFAAIASVGNDEALRALAGMLRMDFGRVEDDYMNNDGLHRLIAAELIDLTGESFGTDGDAWTKWIESRPK